MSQTYFTPGEVVVHNTRRDIWVSFLGHVYNLTSLVREFEGSRTIKPILAYAGKDISHLFDHRTRDVRYCIHPITSVPVPYMPHGPLPHVEGQVPSTRWRPLDTMPWWRDPKYEVGFLTEKARQVCITNVLTKDVSTITVCCEDTMSRILERYLPFNAHAASYTWKFDTRVLDMDKTLDQNGIPDERDIFLDAGLSDNTYVPTLLLYYNDDLTYL